MATTARGARSLHTLWDDDRSPLGTRDARRPSAPSTIRPRRGDRRPLATPTPAPTSAGRSPRPPGSIRGDVGVEVITVDQGDWDMHSGMGTAERGWMTDNARDLATAIAAFFADLGDQADKVTLVTISEFGRRVEENASQGLDHGYGNVMFVAGAGVKGGRYYGSWPGLHRATTPTCWSPPTTAACWPRSCRSGSARRRPTVFPRLLPRVRRRDDVAVDRP